jgi:DnaJ-domain-containing protein 1
MNDPYEQLGLPPDSDDATIRRRYLELVRQYSPDQAPERFAEIHAAYDALRDPAKRVEARVLDLQMKAYSLESITAQLQERLRDRRFPVSMLVSWADST